MGGLLELVPVSFDLLALDKIEPCLTHPYYPLSSSSLGNLGNSGVVTGKNLVKVLEYAKAKGFAIPAFNVSPPTHYLLPHRLSSSPSRKRLILLLLFPVYILFNFIAALEGARECKAPVMIQVSQGGAAFFAGKGMKNGNQEASIAGPLPLLCLSVIMHSDHCAKKLLPWFDGMLTANEEYYKKHGEPLFSSHMLDLSEESKEENIEICVKYFARMAKIDLWLEMEIGITGGEEDGVNNENVDNAALYTQPEDIGNVHGVYKPGNVSLQPELLGKHQAYCKEQLKTDDPRPLYLVFHGGSGSTKKEIATALENGVVKTLNGLTWKFPKLLRLQERLPETQVGNPDAPDGPNKKYYDPRVWVREGEKTMSRESSKLARSQKRQRTLRKK
ncbi:hypothetical protein KEM48_003630 [Puccinia striiformis f. sp. tritici PST-130]|nr:hypothetical protein KEM48_003630 [Puccinia striiformis f. sp. tritici PST-130]